MAVSRRVTRGAVLSLLIVSLTLGGCGRRGRLEPAPDPNAPPRSEVTKQGVPRRPKNPPIAVPHDSFILDPLL